METGKLLTLIHHAILLQNDIITIIDKISNEQLSQRQRYGNPFLSYKGNKSLVPILRG